MMEFETLINMDAGGFRFRFILTFKKKDSGTCLPPCWGAGLKHLVFSLAEADAGQKRKVEEICF